MTKDFGLNILSFPGATATRLENTPLLTNLFFIPLARSLNSVPGVLVDSVQYGVFKVVWKVSRIW